MKNIAVVCNNYKEFSFFMDTVQWDLSKQNKPYRCIKNCIVDIERGVKYIHIPVISMSDYLQGRELHDYVLMCGISDEQFELLRSYIKN